LQTGGGRKPTEIWQPAFTCRRTTDVMMVMIPSLTGATPEKEEQLNEHSK